jgi:succinate dehydrogenase/fumarate reductase flavoprotein subunit
MHWLKHEGNEALINHLSEEGIDLRRNPVEFMTYEMFSLGAIYSNTKTETSVKGLYAAGDETLGGISAAATFGWIAGENAAEYAKRAESSNIERENARIHEKKGLLEEIRSRRVGPDWREANIALQQVMSDYAGSVRSESFLEAGLSHIRRLKNKLCATVRAKNQHELVRVLEIINLFDLAELVFVAVRKENERPVTKWIEIGRWEH